MWCWTSPPGFPVRRACPPPLRAHWNRPTPLWGGAPVGHRCVRVDGLCPPHPGSCRRAEPSGDPKSGRLRRAGWPRRGQSRRAAVRQAVPRNHCRCAGRAAACHRVLRDYLFKDSRKGRVFPVSRPPQGCGRRCWNTAHPCHGRGKQPCRDTLAYTPGVPIDGCSLPAPEHRCTATANTAAARRAALPCKAAACALCADTGKPMAFSLPAAAAPWKEFWN